MKPHPVQHCVCIFLLMLISSLASGQDIRKEENEEQFRVRAMDNNASVEVVSKQSERIGQSMAVVTVINRRELELFGARSLGEVLDRAVSSYLLGTFAFPNNQYSIRSDVHGSWNSRVLILINGRPTLSSSTEGIDFPLLAAFPLDSIERLEIQRGPGSVYHGSGAITGAINIVTRRPTEHHEVNLELGSGSRDTLITRGAGGLANIGEIENPSPGEQISVYGGYHFLRSNGWDGELAPRGGTELETVNWREESAGTFGELYFKGLSFQALYAESTMSSLNNVTSSPLINQELLGRKIFANIGYQGSFFGWRFQLNNTFVNDTGFLEGDVVVNSTDYFSELTLARRLSDTWTLVLGTEASYLTGGDTEDPVNILNSYDVYEFRGYAELQYHPFEFIKLLAAAQFNVFADDDEVGSNRLSNLSPKLGIQIDVLPSIAFKGIVTTGYRNPTRIEEAFKSLVDAELQQEEIITAEAQLLAQFTKLYAAGTFFWSRLDNRIQFQQLDDSSVFIGQNIDRSISTSGFEFETKIALYRNLFITGSFTLLQNQAESEEPNVLLINSTHAPERFVKLGVAWYNFNRFSFGLYASHLAAPAPIVLEEYIDTLNPVPGAFTWVTAHAGWQLSDAFKVKLYVENLLDEQVYYPEISNQAINSIPGRPGIGAWFSVVYRFGLTP